MTRSKSLRVSVSGIFFTAEVLDGVCAAACFCGVNVPDFGGLVTLVGGFRETGDFVEGSFAGRGDFSGAGGLSVIGVGSELGGLSCADVPPTSRGRFDDLESTVGVLSDGRELEL